MKKLLEILASVRRSDVLLVAATVVAALRLMLINAIFIDFNVKQWPLFEVAEVWSGLAFAVLEGMALAYVARRWRRLKPVDATGWVYWSILLIGQLTLLAAIVGVTGYAAAATRRGLTIDELLGPSWSIAWSMIVAGINPLVVILIGIVEDEKTDEKAEKAGELPRAVREAWAMDILEGWRASNGKKKTPTVRWLVTEYATATGGHLPPDEADAAIVGWRSLHKINGRRPAEQLNGSG